MKNIFSIRLILASVLMCVYFIPQSINAAELLFKVNDGVEIDTSKIVEVYVDPQAKKLNVIEGTIKLSGSILDAISVQVENGQSILSLWPTPPQYNDAEHSISFIGGVPSGFDTRGLLFRIKVSSSVEGDLGIQYTEGSAYLNDGKGTKESVSSNPVTVRVYNENEYVVGGTNSGANQKNILENSFSKSNYGILILLIGLVGVLLSAVVYVYQKNIKK